MKSSTKITKQELLSFTVESVIKGSIHAEYLEYKNSHHDERHDDEIIDTVLAPALNKHLGLVLEAIKSKPEVVELAWYSTPEYDHQPSNEEETKELNIKMRMLVQVRLANEFSLDITL